MRAQLRQLARDPVQVVARRVAAGPDADGVGQLPQPVQLRGQQVDPGGQRRPHRVGRGHQVEHLGVAGVHALDQLRPAQVLGQAPAARHRQGLAVQQHAQVQQVVPAGVAAPGPQLPRGVQGLGAGVEVGPEPGHRLLGPCPSLPGDPGQVGPLQQSAARVVLKGEQGGLDRLVLGAEPRQGTVHLLPAQHFPAGIRGHRSPLCGSGPVGPRVGAGTGPAGTRPDSFPGRGPVTGQSRYSGCGGAGGGSPSGYR